MLECLLAPYWLFHTINKAVSKFLHTEQFHMIQEALDSNLGRDPGHTDILFVIFIRVSR